MGAFSRDGKVRTRFENRKKRRIMGKVAGHGSRWIRPAIAIIHMAFSRAVQTRSRDVRIQEIRL